MNVVFLDYDGVVNTHYWTQNESGWHTIFNYPRDNRVSNAQAVQWVSDFCHKYDYHIVVSSDWKTHTNWQECLVNSGLRSDIKILGHTAILANDSAMFSTRGRSEEIACYLLDHPEINRYLIFDDNTVNSIIIDKQVFNLSNHLVLCNHFNGFLCAEYVRACYLHEHYDTIA